MKISTLPKVFGQWWLGLVREMAPVVLFFFLALMWILLMFKLFVAQYAIEYYAFTKAAIGALIIGKAVLVMEWADSRRRQTRMPLAIVVLLRTMVYGLAVLALGIGDRIFHGIRETGSLRAGFALVLANARIDRFVGLVILISVIVGVYLTFQEINRAMGQGALRRLFFERPALEPPAIAQPFQSTT